jgi:serine-type D-Ala-D-Ala carboxypeptidase/endopeptidase (penicillin-binding protein 4)
MIILMLLGSLAMLVGTSAALGSPALWPGVAKIMAKPQYRRAHWGLLVVDPRTGARLQAVNPRDLFIPGSTTKLFTISTAWNTLGPRHRFTTPVYALGTHQGTVLNGNLILVASGDLTMGGRTTKSGAVAFANVDHIDANSAPGATLTPENPLAGINQIAAQVRRAGITQVHGDVIVDDRLFAPDPALVGEDPTLDPMIINDNLIDVQVTPTRPGQPAKVFWRPQTASYTLTSNVRTVKATKNVPFPPNWGVTTSSASRLVVSGTIPQNAGRQLQTVTITDPAAFARTALIGALAHAGVSVSAPTTGANPAQELPASRSYPSSVRVAAYVSPPYREYAKLILKVSHNLGAQLSLCLLAVHMHSTNCADGFRVEHGFLRRIGVDISQVSLLDGRGGLQGDLFTPTAIVKLLSWWLHHPGFTTFRRSLPILGVDGSLASDATHTPARGKVFAKTGTTAAGDELNLRLVLVAKALAGYLQAGPNRFLPFAEFVNSAFYPNIQGILSAGGDLGDIAALLQEHAARLPRP